MKKIATLSGEPDQLNTAERAFRAMGVLDRHFIIYFNLASAD